MQAFNTAQGERSHCLEAKPEDVADLLADLIQHWMLSVQ